MTTTTSKLSHYIHKSGIKSNHHRLAADSSIPTSKSTKHRMQHFKCAANHHANYQPTAKPWSAQHQISTQINLVYEYRGVKAKNEGVFYWLIRKKRKNK
jgi:hypothetical protein